MRIAGQLHCEYVTIAKLLQRTAEQLYDDLRIRFGHWAIPPLPCSDNVGTLAGFIFFVIINCWMIARQLFRGVIVGQFVDN